jgi:hypothetical protein
LALSAQDDEQEILSEQEEIQVAGSANRPAASFPRMREPYLRCRSLSPRWGSRSII